LWPPSIEPTGHNDAVRIEDPSGRTWWVGRRWLPWKPRKRARVDKFNEDGLELLEALEHPVLLVIGLLVLFPALAILLLLLLEWLAVLALVPLLALVRLALPVPWTVVARRRDPDGTRYRYATAVRGWGASRVLMESAAGEIRQAGEPTSFGTPNVRYARRRRAVT
jgi:hypothetical protein